VKPQKMVMSGMTRMARCRILIDRSALAEHYESTVATW
jgi:hypothetical protein